MAKQVGTVDILVNNAGLALGTATADETPYEDMLNMIVQNCN